MTQRKIMVTWQTVAAMLLIFCAMGFAGGFPLSMLAWIFFGGRVALDVLLILGLLVGTWVPLYFLFGNTHAPENSWRNLLPRNFSPLVLMITAFAFTVLVPVIWTSVAPAFVVSMAVYIISGQNLLTTLVMALAANIVLVMSLIQVNDTPPVQIFSQVQTMQDNFGEGGIPTITLSDDDVQQTTRGMQRQQANDADDTDDKIRYLPDEDDYTDETDAQSQRPDNIITMPPQSDTRRDDAN